MGAKSGSVYEHHFLPCSPCAFVRADITSRRIPLNGEGVFPMFDGYLLLLPLQGAIVAAVFLGIGIYKVVQGDSGVESVKWNAIAIGCAIYLFLFGVSALGYVNAQ